jgi:hypothetical protein
MSSYAMYKRKRTSQTDTMRPLAHVCSVLSVIVIV